jgi:phosphoglycerol transferase
MPKKIFSITIITISYILLVLSALILTITDYKLQLFGDVKIAELSYYFFNDLNGANMADYYKSAIASVPLLIILVFMFLFPAIDLYKNRVYVELKVKGILLKINLSHLIYKLRPYYALVVFGVSLFIGLHSFDVFNYVYNSRQNSDFIAVAYVDPAKAEISAPANKRNLIYIYLESVENTLLARQNGGMRDVSVMPELEAMALSPGYVNFSNNNTIGGALPLAGATWTVGSMTAQTSGLPLITDDVGPNDMSMRDNFLPGAYTIGDYLNTQGYFQQLLIGSGASFGGRDKLFSQHGNYDILDYNKAKELGLIAPDYNVWWGYEDKKLFDFAKNELTKASLKQPFNFNMLTVDTHHLDGYPDASCPKKFDRQYDNVYACASLMVSDFINWLQQQPFYNNTTIVITGDHLGMQTDYFESIINGQEYQRTTYNLIINPVKSTDNTKNREFSALDMYPTTLSALGYDIKGGALGLGVDLFSDNKTIFERYGVDFVNTELTKQSSYYKQQIIKN